MIIDEILAELRAIGIDTSKDIISCEDHIDKLNTLLSTVFKDIATVGCNECKNCCKLHATDGYLLGAENEGSFFFEWHFIVKRDDK